MKTEESDYNFVYYSDDGYMFYYGDILLGSIFEYDSGWDALSIYGGYGRVKGFKTHIDAGNYLVQIFISNIIKEEEGKEEEGLC